MNRELLKSAATEEEKKERRETLLAAVPALKILRAALESRLKEKETGAEKIADYDSPSWAYKQADQNGSSRELKYLISLLTIEEQE